MGSGLCQFLVLRLSLTLEETILGTEVITMGLKMIFPLKIEAAGCCMELVLGTAILAAATWFVACIQQPNDPSFCKYSNFPGIRYTPTLSRSIGAGPSSPWLLWGYHGLNYGKSGAGGG